MIFLVMGRPCRRSPVKCTTFNHWSFVMKLTSLLCAILFTGASLLFASPGKAQELDSTFLTIGLENEPLKNAFKKIEQQTPFRFAFIENQVASASPLNIPRQKRTLRQTLNILFANTKFEYTVNKNSIIVIEKRGISRLPQLVTDTTKNIIGKITGTDGQPLSGISVTIKGTQRGAVTDDAGLYRLPDVEENSILLITGTGFKPLEVMIGSRSELDAQMEAEIRQMDDVVVVGYGKQRKANLTGAVSTVKGTELTTAPLASTANTLAGRLPGLISLQSSGQPGADAAALSIRGFGNALIIVDGVETEFNNIDPNQIETITILKDGSAAIYGSRAGNGVILVTTKRGSSGKPTISLNSSYTAQAITAFPKMSSSGQITEMSREAWLNSGRPDAGAPYTAEQVQRFYDGTDPQYPNTDWYSLLIRKFAPQQQHNLSVRGGSDKIKYYGFLGFVDQGAIWKSGNGGNYKRYNLQSNIDAKISDDLTLQLDLAATNEYRRFPWRSQERALWTDFWQTFPMYPATLPDPAMYSFAQGGGTGGAHLMTNSDIAGYDNTDNQNLRGTIALTYAIKPVRGLSAKAFVNYLQYSSYGKTFVKPLTFYTYDYASETYTKAGSLYEKAFLTQSAGRSRILTSQFSLNYDRVLATDHHVSALALMEIIDYANDGFSGGRRDFLTTAIDQLFMGTLESATINGYAAEMGRKSFVGRLNYAYKGKYLIESTLRADASAKFPSDQRWGYFPSISLGWRVTEENFMDGISNTLDNLKLRASFGQSGNDGVGNFQYLTGYVSGSPVMLGGSQQTGMTSTGLANPDLTWERIKIYNAGIDFSLFNRKLYGVIEAFYRERAGIPANRLTSLPSTFGANLPPENLNSLSDRGFELQLGTAGSSADFMWDISGNISYSRAKWGHFEEPDYTDPEQARVYKRSGTWTDRDFGYLSDGLFTSEAEITALKFDQDGRGNVSLKPGDIRYKDVNGDGILDWKDQVEIGKGTVPRWMFGINTNLKFKNFDLAALFQGAFGYFNNINLLQANGLAPRVYYELRWTEQNNTADAFIPRLGSTAATNSLHSDHYYKKAGYLRLKTLSIGYNLPAHLLRSIKFNQVRVYAAGTNLYTFNPLRKYETDPEAPSNSSGYYYPQQLTVTLGVNISF